MHCVTQARSGRLGYIYCIYPILSTILEDRNLGHLRRDDQEDRIPHFNFLIMLPVSEKKGGMSPDALGTHL